MSTGGPEGVRRTNAPRPTTAETTRYQTQARQPAPSVLAIGRGAGGAVGSAGSSITVDSSLSPLPGLSSFQDCDILLSSETIVLEPLFRCSGRVLAADGAPGRWRVTVSGAMGPLTAEVDLAPGGAATLDLAADRTVTIDLPPR